MNLINPFDLINENESNATESFMSDSYRDPLTPAGGALN